MLPLNNFSYSHLTHSATTHSVIINTIHESVTQFFSTLPHKHLWSPTSYQVYQVKSCICVYKSNYTCIFLCVCTYTLPSSPTNDHLWGDPGRPGKNIQRAMYHTCVYVHTLVQHNSFSILPHKHLFGGLCNTYQVHQVRTHTGSATNYSILNIIHECVKHSFLYSPSSTPVVCFLYQGIQVRIPRELATVHTLPS